MDIVIDAGDRADGDQRGFGLIGLIATIAILGLLAVIAVKSIPTGPAGAPGGAVAGLPPATNGRGTGTGVVPGLVPQAGDTAAQGNLRSALSAVDQAAVRAGGFGTVNMSSLLAQSSGVPLTAHGSTSAAQISVAAAGGAGGGLTLAVRSASGSCWYVWTSGAATWYGVEPDRARCNAPALAIAPVAGVAGTGAIDWQSGAFPAR
jgi:hypothetical protein